MAEDEYPISIDKPKGESACDGNRGAPKTDIATICKAVSEA
jgi:hypothetical protein